MRSNALHHRSRLRRRTITECWGHNLHLPRSLAANPSVRCSVPKDSIPDELNCVLRIRTRSWTDTVVDGHGRGTVVDTGTVAWHGALGTVVRARSWISTVTVLDTHSRGHPHGRTIAA